MRDPRTFRIAHILPFAAVGGTEIATLRLATAAAQLGYENEIFRLKEASEVADWLNRHSMVGVPYTAPRPSLRHASKWWRESTDLANTFRSRGIGLVHCSDIGSAYTVGLAGKLAGLPVLSHVRNRYSQLPWRERAPLRLVNHFAFVSRDTWLRFAVNVPASRGTVLYDGIDPEPLSNEDRRIARISLMEEFRLPQNAKLIGMVARIAPQKDFQTLITAARPLIARYPHAHFILIGEYSRQPAYLEHYELVRRWLEQAQLSHCFSFTDYRPNVSALLSALDIFVLCTNWEGFPLVILEAMARGLPVVATAVDGIPEIVEDGVTGLLHRHADASHLSAQLDRLLDDHNLCAELASAGQRLVATRFSGKSFQNSVHALYRSICVQSE